LIYPSPWPFHGRFRRFAAGLLAGGLLPGFARSELGLMLSLLPLETLLGTRLDFSPSFA